MTQIWIWTQTLTLQVQCSTTKLTMMTNTWLVVLLASSMFLNQTRLEDMLNTATPEDQYDEMCDPNNPRVSTFADISAAAYRIRSGVLRTPCTVSYSSGMARWLEHLAQDRSSRVQPVVMLSTHRENRFLTQRAQEASCDGTAKCPCRVVITKGSMNRISHYTTNGDS